MTTEKWEKDEEIKKAYKIGKYAQLYLWQQMQIELFCDSIF